MGRWAACIINIVALIFAIYPGGHISLSSGGIKFKHP